MCEASSERKGHPVGGGLGEAPQAERGKAWPLRWAWLYSDQRTYTPYLEKALSLREESLPLSLGGSQSEDRGRWAGLEGAGPLGVQASVKVRKAEQGPEGHLHPHGDQPGVRPWLGGGVSQTGPKAHFQAVTGRGAPRQNNHYRLLPQAWRDREALLQGWNCRQPSHSPPAHPPHMRRRRPTHLHTQTDTLAVRGTPPPH